MKLTLERQELLQLHPISMTGTLKLLPLGKKNKQKLIIGDGDGNLYCYEFKKGEPQLVFQMKPFDNNQPIASVSLGGDITKTDKIFVAQGQRIVGLTKKGKEFFKLTSALTEPINNIIVEETQIWSGCENILNRYDNGQDAAYYMNRDRINCICIDKGNDKEIDAILGCQDNTIRIIRGSNPILEIPMMTSITSIVILSTTPKLLSLVVGLSNGTITNLIIDKKVLSVQYNWSLDDSIRSSIICMKIHHIDTMKPTNSSSYPEEIVIGRADGRLEVICLEISGVNDNDSVIPTIGYTAELGESIMSIDCGVVNTVGCTEIIIALYSGRIVSFTTESLNNRSQEDTAGRSISAVNNENRLKALKKEIDGLKIQVEKEKDKLSKLNTRSSMFSTLTGSNSTNNTSATSSAASNAIPPAVAPDINILHTWALNTELAAYIFTLELQVPIDMVIVRSPIQLDLLESEVGTSVISICPPYLLETQADNEFTRKSVTSAAAVVGNINACKYVLVVRCQSQEKRIQLILRPTEGKTGDLSVTVVADTTPKAAKILRCSLKPLSMHTRIHSLTPEEENRPRNRVRFNGKLNLTLVHDWIQGLFPDIPPHISEENTDSIRLYFRHCFNHAICLCEYRKNEILIESENPTIIAIAKEQITANATYRRVQLDENLVILSETIPSFLKLIWDKLSYQMNLEHTYRLLEGLLEVTAQESDNTNATTGNSSSSINSAQLSWLSPVYKDLLANQDTIRKEYKRRTVMLQQYISLIIDMAQDYNKLKGIDFKEKSVELRKVLSTISQPIQITDVINVIQSEQNTKNLRKVM